ncbi:MAG: hypothetical protein K1X57_21300 [Gemmataceae bacterium]|nr:hypothetical protein [Gemmataceae bacterium]
MPHRLVRCGLVFAAALMLAGTTARADIVAYEMAGQPGDQASSAATLVTPGVSALALSRGAGLTPTAGANSINSSGWSTDPTDFYLLGFTVAPGFTAFINSIAFAGRSSNTGPGFVNVLYSVDNGPETLLTTLTMAGTAFNNQSFNFAQVTANSSFRVFFRAANTTSANGGTIAAAGTFRLGDYSPDGGTTFLPISLGGSVATAAVPEPSQVVLVGVMAAGLVVARLRRRPA